MRLPRMFAEATHTYSLKLRRLERLVRWRDHVIGKPAAALSFKHTRERRIGAIVVCATEHQKAHCDGGKAASMRLPELFSTVLFALKEGIFGFLGKPRTYSSLDTSSYYRVYTSVIKLVNEIVVVLLPSIQTYNNHIPRTVKRAPFDYETSFPCLD